MDQLTLATVRRLLDGRRLERLALEGELCQQLGMGWSRSVVAVHWLIEEEILIQDEDGSLGLATAARGEASPRSR